MPLSTTNTFVLTTAATALATSRGHINGSLQAVSQNFYSDAPPAAVNFLDDGGSSVSFTDTRTLGILHWNSDTNALYVNVPNVVHAGEGPTGVAMGGFTRAGIGARYEYNIVGAKANIAKYQLGEVMVNVDSSNVRLMVKGANSAAQFTDIGIPPSDSVTSAMLVDDAITLAKITARNVSNAKILADTISIHELNSGVNAGLNPIGSILGYGAGSAPTGYYLCDGTAISRTGVNANLFSIIGTAFGVGNGNNTFNVPKLDDALLLGKGANNSTLGTQTHSMSASSTKASESTSLSAHSLTSASFATSAKDSSTATAVTAVADHAAITPNMIFPTVVVNFIIRF
jgi:microcystin-dependent protein